MIFLITLTFSLIITSHCEGFKSEAENNTEPTINPNPCEKVKCQNGAKCTSYWFRVNFICQCLRGTRGEYCQFVDECTNGSISCTAGSNATCGFDVQKKKATCICPNLELEYNENTGSCEEPCPLQCINGRCVKKSHGDAKCYCSSGYTGRLCELKDVCYGTKRYSLCRNGGKCITTGVNQYQCECLFPFTGLKCEQKLPYLRTTPSPPMSTISYTRTSSHPDRFRPSTSVPDWYRPSTSVPDWYRPSTSMPDWYRPSTYRPGWFWASTSRPDWFRTDGDYTTRSPKDRCQWDNECRNGGTCWRSRLGNRCICKRTFRGEFCEIDLVNKTCEVLNPSCKAIGAQCKFIESTLQGVCECPFYMTYNRTLKKCEDICQPNSCDRGQCMVIDYQKYCRCYDGFTGQRCNEVLKVKTNSLAYILIFAGIVVAAMLAFALTTVVVCVLLKRLKNSEDK